MKFFKNNHLWLILALVVFVLLRFPSLVEPNWYGDEGIYQVVGNALREGRVLYQQIWDNKPPLLYVIYALSNSNLYTVKLLSLISGLASVVAFYFLSKKLFKKRLSITVSVLIYSMLFGTPLLEGNIANAENFMLFPTVLSAYFVITYYEDKKLKDLIIAGLLLSLSLLLKVVAVFDFFAFLFFLIILNGKITTFKLRSYLFFFFSFISLLSISSVYFLIKGAFWDFIQAVFLQNLSYVGEENSLLLPMGNLIFKSIILIAIVVIIKRYKHRLEPRTIFIYLWSIFGIYSAFFSDRPYTHYLLLVLPSFCLLVGNIFEERRNKIIGILMLSAIILIAFFHFQIYKKTIAYYQNFFSFMLSNKSITDYESFFDRNTPRDYMLADFIKSNVSKNESVFLWSDSPQIYALSNKLPIGKYIVAYHIKFYDNADIVTYEQIENAKPKYIIQTAQGPVVNNALSSYQLKYIIDDAKIYER